MDNMYGTPAGPPDRANPAGSTNPSTRSRKKWLLSWGVGITVAGFLAGGAIALAASSGSTAAPAAGTASAASQVQGTTLNSALNTAGSAAATSARVRWALGRLRAVGGIYGEVTFHNKAGYHTLAFERGAITSISGSNVVVRAPDGTTWTWVIVSDTVVRQNGKKTATSALAAGQTVFTGGPIVSGAKDIRLIVIRPAGSGSSSSGSGSPSPGSSSSSSGSSSSSSVSGPGGTSVS